ncbi:type VI secretion system tube protein Hcp, partial [Enterobacter cloacae]|nr:type VI secretion system tube protein Hcp [Enterobacter cloacae]
TPDLYPGANTGTHLETVLIRYEKITWKHCDGNVVYSDAWNERATY